LNKDRDVLIISLGGSTLINGNTAQQLHELNRLNCPVHVLIDSERDSPAEALSEDRQQFVANSKSLGFDPHVLERRALENYFSEEAIQKVKGPKYKALALFDKLENVPLSWGKHENARIAMEMTLREVEGTDLLRFLKSMPLGGRTARAV
jgi:hypothetical protein